MNQLYPLTNAQKSIWVADNLYPNKSHAISAVSAVICEEMYFTVMNEAINIVIKNNDAIRIRFVIHHDTPQQYFSDFNYQQFPILDFSYENGEKDYQQWEKAMTETPFNLIDTDLFYFAMIKLGKRKNICYFKFHHTTTDAWGLALVIRKTLKEYWQLIQGVDSEDIAEPSFIDHIYDELQYMASERYGKHREFWSDVFETVPEFISFTDHKGLNNLVGKRQGYVLSQSLSSKLHNFCEQNNVSSFSVFYALLALYLSKRSNKKDIAIETPILNRTGQKEKNTAGLFMHNIPTRLHIEPNLDFLTFVKESFRELKKFMKNQRYPYSNILKDFREKHQFAGTLVDVTLNYHNFKLDSIIEYEAIWNYPGAQTNSLSISVSDKNAIGLPVLDYDYLIEVFSKADIHQMHENICILLTNALEHPEKKLFELQMFSQEELDRLLIGQNQTESPYEAKQVSELFEEQVMISPGSTAIVFNDQRLTYCELNERANQLAHYIRSQGVKRNSIVGLMVNRSLEMVIGILGILKAGAAYLPIDPAYPSERISYMLNQSHTCLTLIDRDKPADIAATANCRFANISLNNTSVYAFNTSNLDKDKKANINDIAYVLFTSGSTGNPKGVMVHHKALCNLIDSVARNLNFKNQTIVALTTISFDIFFGDTILPLTKGMKVIIANEEEQTIPKHLYQLLVKHQVKVLQSTPSKMKQILSEQQGRDCLNELSHVLITGEAFPPSLLPQLKSATQAEIYNLYGPTETTIWSTMTNVTHSEKITIGKPIANTQIYILDEYLSPVTFGSVGEIFIAGDGVSLGYLNKPELTKERFLPNPYMPGKTMYQTGDLGQWLANGEIDCLGRNDNQVKIRGLRIEIEEIEACLLTHASVKEAVVTVREDKLGKKHLCAYLTSDKIPSSEELRFHILKSLPNYMVPAWFTWLNSIPLTPNGKVDRRALPEPSEIDFGQLKHTYIAPSNDLEWKLALLWAEALEVVRVGIDDNLFALGGDSLTILEIMSGALSYTWKLNAQDFYECPTIRQLSSKLSGGTQDNHLNEEAIDFYRRESPVEIIIKPEDPGNVLLIGATGFLGIHLLMELLNQTDNIIYCLVRGNQIKERLDKLLDSYFPLLPISLMKRIIIIQGDITFQDFGLSAEDYNELAQNVQTVINSAALVKHYGHYCEFENNNVHGTDEVINFCMKFGIRLNHISTISISGNFVVDSKNVNTIFRERDFYIGQDYKSNVYVRSKFIAENQVLQAQSKGLKATIFRIGVLTGRYQDGKFQHNIEQNAFYRRIKSLVALRIVPESFNDQTIEFTPVDTCAKAILNIIKVNQADGVVFHIYNHQKIKAIDLIHYLRKLNISIQTLKNWEFESIIAQLSQTKEGKETLSGLVSDLCISKSLNYSNTVTINSTFTINYLQQTAFAWPVLDIEYLSKVLNYMHDVGFISNSVDYTINPILVKTR